MVQEGSRRFDATPKEVFHTLYISYRLTNYIPSTLEDRILKMKYTQKYIKFQESIRVVLESVSLKRAVDVIVIVFVVVSFFPQNTFICIGVGKMEGKGQARWRKGESTAACRCWGGGGVI